MAIPDGLAGRVRANKDRVSLELNFTSRLLLAMERLYVGLHVNHTKAAVCLFASPQGLTHARSTHSQIGLVSSMEWWRAPANESGRIIECMFASIVGM